MADHSISAQTSADAHRIRIVVVAVVALVCLITGLVVRTNAVEWSVPPGVTAVWNRAQGEGMNRLEYEWYVDLSWLLLGIGALLITVCAHHWIRAARRD